MALTQSRLTRPVAASDATALVLVLAVASVIELAILRTFTRTAIHIPALEQMQQPYEWLAGTGRYAYFVSLALLLPVLALLAVRVASLHHRAKWLAVFSLAVFGLSAGLSAAGALSATALGATTVWTVLLLSSAVGVALGAPRASAIPAVCLGVAFALSGAYTLLPGFEVHAQPAWLLDGAELFAVAFALSLPLVVAGRDRPAVIAGLCVGCLALAVFLGNGSTSRFLLLWNVGLAGTLPSFVYAAAAGTLSFAAVQLHRSGSVMAGLGVVLLVTGGIGLHSSYQSALVVAGLGALYLGLLPGSSSAAEVDSLPR